MQLAGDKDPEASATCPYNPAHRMPKFRMQRHLVKCKSNNIDAMLVTCPHNFSHRVPQPQLAYHLESCPDRINLDRILNVPEVIDRVPEQLKVTDALSEECWDNEETPSYDPDKHIVEKNILRQLKCESKAKRRDFRIEERNRISRINEEQHAASLKAGGARREPQAAMATRGAWDSPGPAVAAMSRRPQTRPAADNTDMYKMRDYLTALGNDKEMLDNLKGCEAVEEDVMQDDTEYRAGDFGNNFPALGRGVSGGRGAYAASLGSNGGRGRGRFV